MNGNNEVLDANPLSMTNQMETIIDLQLSYIQVIPF